MSDPQIMLIVVGLLFLAYILHKDGVFRRITEFKLKFGKMEMEVKASKAGVDYDLDDLMERIGKAKLPSIQDAEQMFSEAERLLSEGNHRAAKRLFDGISPHDDVDVKCKSLISVSSIYKENGDFIAEAESLQEGIRLAPTDMQIVTRLREKLRACHQKMRVKCYVNRLKNCGDNFSRKVVNFNCVPSVDELAQYLVALSNDGGGAILIGYDKNGDAVGVSEGQISGVFDCALFEKTEPVCICELVDNRLIVVEEGLLKPYHANGICWLIGKESKLRKAEKEEIQKMKENFRMVSRDALK